ncbi:hypothetical protein ABIF07_001078 [Bradyrhizobium elkanii]|uniref:hypothetical protein n=1 Tax=Bradyrhizobium elkanii TaxID=29448 RepID=UPI002167C4FE|nr:hypothetical protein [Bradyrhizobium elkanii]MCS3692006.1 hypothetical protein [Bradyrhizobium elkanii]
MKYLRLLSALGALFYCQIAMAAGTITMSLTQRFDNSTHLPLAGGQMYFIQAGTTSTPQNAYQDSALTIPYANPLTLDSGGNIPQLFFADGVIKVRITNSLGVQQLVQDNIQVTGASSGGGGGGTVDPTTIFTTGDVKYVYGSQPINGWVRLNGRTIGSAVSGATERANADCQALFVYLWGDPNSVVPGGKGASASADWAANKVITLPDARGRVIAGLDDMGNSAAGRLTSTYFGTAATALGAAGGGQSQTLALLNLPPYTPAGSLSLSTIVSTGVSTSVTGSATVNSTNWVASNPSDASFLSAQGGGPGGVTAASGGSTSKIQSTGTISATATSTANSSATTTGTFTGSAQGGASSPFRTLQPTILMTFYVKL